MWRLIIVLLFLIASVWFGLTVVKQAGFLLIVYHPWIIQMPLWFVFLASVLFLGLFYLLISSIDQLHFMWFRWRNWLRVRREHRLYSKTQAGLAALIEGRWYKAERWLLAGIDQSADPLINYLGAAKAAQKQGAYDRADNYIEKANQCAPEAKLAIGLVKAELELAQDKLEQASATLNHLRQSSPRQPRVLKLLEKVYVRLADWKNLQLLLPALLKAKLISPEQAEQFEKNIYVEILDKEKHHLDALHNIWADMPRRLRKNPEMVYAYVCQLLHFESNPACAKEVEDLIRYALKHGFHPALVNLYGTLSFKQTKRQLVIAGAWLKMYGAKSELLLLLGKFCVNAQLWGKAKDYFEKCLALSPNAEASLEYGKLLEYLGEVDEAREKYRDGLAQLAAQQLNMVENQAMVN